MRDVRSLNKNWYFHPGEDIADDARFFGNVQIIANETNLWQKAGNHGPSKAANPHIKTWRQVDVPHDYALEGEFTSSVAAGVGALERGKAIYVKHFELATADHDKRIHLEFDGVFRDCQVFVNGSFVGRHLSGYTSFGFDISELCEFGAVNAVAVHIDATDNELWSYEGAGIYRSVRLVTTSPVFVPRWGTFVRTGTAEQPNKVIIETKLANMTYEAVSCELLQEIYAPSGELVCSLAPVAANIDAIEQVTLEQTTQLENPVLWSVDNPQRYTLVTKVVYDGHECDQVETHFGVRYFNFDPEQGFFLNGTPLKLKGVCCHQDHACVGVAVPPAVQEYRVARLKDLGCNAFRTSHNPPDPALLDACDKLGMLVMDEVRLSGSTPEFLNQLESLVLRDRNHPSVIMWSIGPEEMLIQHTEQGIKTFKRMQHLGKKLDPSRVTTYGMNMMWIDICDLHDQAGFRVDVFGANYRSSQRSENYDDFHAKYPDWPLIGSETFGGGATRGLFEPDQSQLPVKIADRWLEHPDNFPDPRYPQTASAYGQTFTPWGYSIEETWQDCLARPFMAGTFIWTGFDYRGETFPYDWPSVISRFGILDYCGFYKEIAHYLRAWWRTDNPHLFIFPHWNWQGREGELIDVWCYANCAEVELVLNGTSLGKKPMPANYRLEWQVPFEAGTLTAIGYDAGGQECLRTYRKTTQAPAQIALKPHKQHLQADGEDCLVIEVHVQDAQGEVHPYADNELTFSVEGAAELLGLGNGNPHSHEPDKGSRRRVFHGLAQAIVKSTGHSGEVKVRVEGWRLEPAELILQAE
ncbi:MAG: beta-galactosidase GalA [Deinococcota bacterium]